MGANSAKLCDTDTPSEATAVLLTPKAQAASLERLNAHEAVHIYSRLPSEAIRVVVLHAAPNFADSIKCSLTTLELSADPSYEALSYVWGSQSYPAVITLNGTDYRITWNLESALRYLRHATKDRYIWIDALAINQCDNVEKSIQVQMMRHIYAAAVETVVWLGYGDEKIVKLFGEIRWLEQMELVNAAEGMQTYFGEDQQRLLDLFDGMTRLAKLPYWKRAWVVQETTFSKSVRVLYGATSMSWDLFSRFWRKATTYFRLINHLCSGSTTFEAGSGNATVRKLSSQNSGCALQRQQCAHTLKPLVGHFMA